MASHPPGACCITGVKHEGEAAGEMKSIGDIETYFAYPTDKSTETAILLITDVIGHDFINAKLIADQFAANGYFVVMPDLFFGDPISLNRPGDFDFPKWLSGHKPDRTDPVVEAALKEMKEKYGCKKIGAVGYCFGGKYVARFLAKGKGVDVGAMAHPSFVDAAEVKGIAGPVTIAAAETDQIFPAPKRRETEDILKEMDVPYQLSLYSDVEHGFAVRADISNSRIKYAKETVFLQFVQWFDEYLKGKRDIAA